MDSSWHERRRRSIGASDTPVILGVPTYARADPLMISWQKRGLLPVPEDTVSVGHRLEPMAREWLSAELGETVDFEESRDSFVEYCPRCRGPCEDKCDGLRLHANLDGRISAYGVDSIVEVKSVGLGNPHRNRWNRGGVPLPVEVQVQHQMLCAQRNRAVICMFDAYHRWSMRLVAANTEFQEWLVGFLDEWWRKYVILAEDPPFNSSDAVIGGSWARWPKPVPEKETEVDRETIASWKAARQSMAEARKKYLEINAKMHLLVKDSDYVTVGGDRVLRRRRNGRGYAFYPVRNI